MLSCMHHPLQQLGRGWYPARLSSWHQVLQLRLHGVIYFLPRASPSFDFLCVILYLLINMWIFLAKSFISSSDKRYLYFENRKYSFCWSPCAFSGIRNPLHFCSLLFGYLNIHFKERKHGHSMARLSREAGTSPLPLSLVGHVHCFICIEPRQVCREQPWQGAQLCSHPTSPLVLFRLNSILQGHRKFLLNIRSGNGYAEEN